MIHQQFTNQLRSDSFNNVILATTTLIIIAGASKLFWAPRNNVLDLLSIVAQIIIPLAVASWCWRLNKMERREQGTYLFLAVHLFFVTFNLALLDEFSPHLIYVYGFYIIISSTLLWPEASFSVWGVCLVLVLGTTLYRGNFGSDLLKSLGPMAFNLVLALGGFITSLDWRDAVESTSVLQMRAQRRRDELFAMQEELTRSHNRQKSLNTQLITSVEVGQRIAALLDLDVLLHEVVELIRGQFNFVYAGIFLLEGRTFMTVRAEAGDKPQSPGRQVRIFVSEENLLGLTASQRQHLIIADERDSQILPHPYLSAKTQSEIGLPLIIGEHLHGVLNIQSYGMHAFNEENLPMLRLLAHQVAIALHNAQLYNVAILARQEAERANEIKSRFLASMSHELRTPLNAVLNFSGFVADGVFGPVNAEQADALEKAIDSGSHLLSLINDILDLAKIEAGTMDMFIQEVDMNNLLKSTASVAKGLLKHKPIQLILDIDEHLPPLSADKRRLRQVLLNLVSNAVKYTKQGSITLAACQQNGLIQISVQDTGIGIPPEDHDLVFEPFRQSQNELFSEMGTGLGLPIAKHFVEAHGGRIWLESQPGVGTTFYVSLPIKANRDKLPVTLTEHSQ
ncbi:MAG: ATP-binding protein [Chloroflexota bacterium]